jgi:pilus assembly protein Flp/PilA
VFKVVSPSAPMHKTGWWADRQRHKEVVVFLRLYTLLKSREEGATMVEYGLMVALIAVVALGAVSILGTNVTGIFQRTADTLGQVP